MPNWTNSTLIVNFNELEDAVDFAALAVIARNDNTEESSLLMHFIPRPDTVFTGNLTKELEDEHGQNTWYYWNNRNWGTKWSETVHKVSIEGKTVKVYMETAWNAPTPLVEAINEDPAADAIMLYCEAGMDFMGYTNGSFDEQVVMSDTLDAYGALPYDEDKEDDDYDEARYESMISARNKYFQDEVGYDMGNLDLGG